MTDLQEYLLTHDRKSVAEVARAFNTTCEEVTKVYHQMVVDGAVARYDAAHRNDDGLHLIDDEEFSCFERFINAYMKKHGLNKVEFAAIVKEFPSAVSRWLYYKQHPRYATVNRMAEELQVDVNDILCYGGT